MVLSYEQDDNSIGLSQYNSKTSNYTTLILYLNLPSLGIKTPVRRPRAKATTTRMTAPI